MEVDYERSKRLTAILSGKEKLESKHAAKLREVQRKMAAKDILKDVKDARAIIKNINLDPGLEREIYLFAFKGKFHQCENGNHKVINDAEAKTLLKEVPETELYYVCTNEGMCPLPNMYVGTDAKAVQLKNDQEVIGHIKRLTGVTIKKSDL